MEGSTQVVTLTDEQDNFLKHEIRKEAERALSSSSPFWNGVEWCLNWLRENFRKTLKHHLQEFEVLFSASDATQAKIFAKIMLDITTVIGATINFLKIAISSPEVWRLAHEGSMIAWKNNERNGVIAQTYAYGKKMAAYILEIIKECFVKAIECHGCKLSEDEKEKLSVALKNILAK